MRKLEVKLDGQSSPTWGRLIPDSNVGKLAGAASVTEVAIPAGAQIAICSASGTFLVSETTFTVPVIVDAAIPAGVGMNGGAYIVEGLTSIFVGVVDEKYYNIEFYRI